MSKARKLIEAGYNAEKANLPCVAPDGLKEIERGAWEQGWRAARRERQELENSVCNSRTPRVQLKV